MTASSILFMDSSAAVTVRAQPTHFPDLYLDQVIDAIVIGKEFYDLKPFFYQPLVDPDVVAFRQDVMRDLMADPAYSVLRQFASRMEEVRKTLHDLTQRYNLLQKQRWLLNAAIAYGDAVEALQAGLQKTSLHSRGLQRFRDYLSMHIVSPPFRRLLDDGRNIETALSRVRYGIDIAGLRVTVEHYVDEPDQGPEVAKLLARFEGLPSKPPAFHFGNSRDVNQVEGRILQLVAQTHGETFDAMARYCADHGDFFDAGIVAFDREAQFYLSYLDYVRRLTKKSLPLCYPHIQGTSKAVCVRDTYDMALAQKLAAEGRTPVRNDVVFDESERIIVITGPNQGGKTTYTRIVGQLFYLASLGCPVPGSEATLYLPDAIFTHFERAETMTSLTGKLEDDVVRIHAILQTATPQSLILINEIFASTTLVDAVALSRKVSAKINKLGALAIWVTFLDEIASEGEKTVSMAATVDSDNPELRTFKIVRQPANGLAYALSIARKYRLTRDLLSARLER